MPIALVLMIANVALIVHAAKTGRFNPWGYILILLPGAGALAYMGVRLDMCARSRPNGSDWPNGRSAAETCPQVAPVKIHTIK